MRRNSKPIAGGFRAGATVDDVAATILDALLQPDHRVQRPVGDDARAIFDRRADVSLDEFVALGDDVSDDEHRVWFATNFGLEL